MSMETSSSAVFKRTSQGFFVVLPCGKLSPCGFVTDSTAEFKRAKSRYYAATLLIIFIMLMHYQYGLRHPDAPTGLLWLALAFICLIALYVIILSAFSKVVIYKESVHGSLLV